MGFFGNVFLSVVLVAGGRSLWRVRSICRPIHVPHNALLAPKTSAQRRTYLDAYKVTITDRALLLLKDTDSREALSPSKVHENVIVMGSAFTLPFALDQPVTSVQASGALLRQALSTLRRSEVPLSDRLKQSLSQIVIASALPIHQNYSRYLLVSTLKRLQQL
ncbi:hypothetical protein TCAL_16235 [Tigriopus californicus]|uniref:Uncharacterized protein n=1 Tax=Tigriopus californicus TaxID=6832 RepID=A0A553P4Y9_TIGCA|nr:hypothetical protein TCAL_16235 [Tigriopus californicus]